MQVEVSAMVLLITSSGVNVAITSLTARLQNDLATSLGADADGFAVKDSKYGRSAYGDTGGYRAMSGDGLALSWHACRELDREG